MTKKNILLALLGVIVLGIVIAAIVILGGNGLLFQGALYNIRPIYSECRIEGKNFNSNQAVDCEAFYRKFQERSFPDGEYTVFAKYVDPRLSDNIIPLKIRGDHMECNFLENGYVPDFSVFPANNELATENIKERREIPVGSTGLVVQLNYQKNGNNYFYDTNICESAFRGTVLDSDKKDLGEVRLDFNGFINSRPLVNQILINDKPYYAGKEGEAVKEFQAGNIFLTLNAFPELLFKFSLPCSAQKIKVTIPMLETSKDLVIPFKGLTKDYLETCGSRLYIGLQNTNKYDDIQIFDDLNLKYKNGQATYRMKLDQINRVIDKDTKFPIIFKLSLHLRDRADSQDVLTLGSGILTVKSYQKEPVELIEDLNATAEVGLVARPKVRATE
jgi:hypothetical protein